MNERSEHAPPRAAVSICVGTSCYVMGGAELLNDVETAIDEQRLYATLRGATCMGHCSRDGGNSRAGEGSRAGGDSRAGGSSNAGGGNHAVGGNRTPCATVNGTLIERATETAISEMVLRATNTEGTQ